MWKVGDVCIVSYENKHVKARNMGKIVHMTDRFATVVLNKDFVCVVELSKLEAFGGT